MNKARFIQIGYYVLSLVLIALVYLIFKATTGWHGYVLWLVALNLITFLVYGIDKGMAKSAVPVRVPENLLHLLALLGGFIGGWVGMFAFRHKINWRAHPFFPIILGTSTIIHSLLIYNIILI
jgi:uncharacterized membrane protein YsdA (DUF1294 family)